MAGSSAQPESGGANPIDLDTFASNVRFPVQVDSMELYGPDPDLKAAEDGGGGGGGGGGMPPAKTQASRKHDNVVTPRLSKDANVHYHTRDILTINLQKAAQQQFQTAIDASCSPPSCFKCGSLSVPKGPRIPAQIITLTSSLDVLVPVYYCSVCAAVPSQPAQDAGLFHSSPAAFGVWPADPVVGFQVWKIPTGKKAMYFDVQLMHFLAQYKVESGAVANNSFAATVYTRLLENGCTPAVQQDIFRKLLTDSFHHFSAAEIKARDLASHGI